MAAVPRPLPSSSQDITTPHSGCLSQSLPITIRHVPGPYHAGRRFSARVCCGAGVRKCDGFRAPARSLSARHAHRLVGRRSQAANERNRGWGSTPIRDYGISEQLGELFKGNEGNTLGAEIARRAALPPPNGQKPY
jgi:hypothetical protein